MMQFTKPAFETGAITVPSIVVGMRISFGDDGEGQITVKNGRRVYLDSPVFKGWIGEAELLAILRPNEG